jgi:predicted dehydrogenase
MNNTKRRTFLQNSGLILGGVSLFPHLLVSGKSGLKISPSETVNFGLIGCKGMGWSNMSTILNNIPGSRCIALCDVDQSVLEQRSKDVNKISGNTPQLFKDYRKLLEHKDIDAVVIGTPDHWHCLMLCDALDAGKHVYCEKPLANSVQEANIMLNAARYHGKIIQIGQWQRSGSHYRAAHEYLKTGVLGNIRLVKCWAYQGWMKPVPIVADSAAPDGVDYDMWLGPAPKRPFNANRFHFNFRWFWDYAGGLMTDWGVHELDIALYFMGAIAPKSVMASGGKLAYPDDASETPDTLQTVFEYDKFNLLWEHATGIDGGPYGRAEGIAFIGNNGTLVVNREGWEVIPETYRDSSERRLKYKIEKYPDQRRNSSDNYLAEHVKNFVAAIKDNNPSILNCGIETGAVAAINAHMGNVAFKTGRKLYWNENTGNFGNDAEANRIMNANYHNSWKLPGY